MGPASPQCGRRTKVWKPLFLYRGADHHHLSSPEPPQGWVGEPGTSGWPYRRRWLRTVMLAYM